MKRQKKTTLLNIETAKSMKLGWKVERQVQQDLLQEKLLKCFSDPNEAQRCIARYPEAMRPMIEDFMRKAEKQMRLNGT